MFTHRASHQLLSATAYWTVSVRGRESEHEDNLFHDPWAVDLAGEIGRTGIESRSTESVVPMIIRTRYFDDFLQRITHEQGILQVVLLTVGLDTRAFRLPWPQGTTIFEVDQPDVLTYKEQILHAAGAKPACARQVIGADLTLPWTECLNVHGFDQDRPSVWLLEGFLFLPGE